MTHYIIMFFLLALSPPTDTLAVTVRPIHITCNSTSTSLTITLAGLDTTLCDGFLVEVVPNTTSTQPLLVSVVPPMSVLDTSASLTLVDLLPAKEYWLRARCHNRSAPSIVQGWFPDAVPIATSCQTDSLDHSRAYNVTRVGSLHPTSFSVSWQWPESEDVFARVLYGIAWEFEYSDIIHKDKDRDVGSATINGLNESFEYNVVIETAKAMTDFGSSITQRSDAFTLRTGSRTTNFTTLYRVSEYINQVDFLDNHNSADFYGQAAFLTSTNDNLFFKLETWPITEYCVEFQQPPKSSSTSLNEGFADYASCNGPEAKPRNNPADPVCICDVYADRLIALQSVERMTQDCGNVSWYPDGSHSDPTCYCKATPESNRSQWTPPILSDKYIGMMPTWLPYFYYQVPLRKYNRTRFGENFSTPKKGKCLPDQTIGDGGCTWKPAATSRVIFGDRLLQRGWNNTVVNHWPLHKFGPNSTDQILENTPIFRDAWDSLSEYFTHRCCGC